MLIKTSYEETVKILSLLQKVVSTKGLNESMKVVNLFIKDNKINIGAADGRLFCLTHLEGQYDLEGESEDNSYFALNIKEIMNVLDKFKSLQRTKVKELEFYVQQEGVVLTVREVAKDENSPTAHLYNQDNKFLLRRENVLKIFQKEIPEMVVEEDSSVEADSADLYKYTVYSYPLLTTPKDLMYLHFKKGSIYSIIGNHYGMLLENKLPENFSDFSLTPYVVGFLREVMSTSDKFRFIREDIWGPAADGSKQIVGIVLTIEVGNFIVKVKTANLTEKEIPKPFIPKPETYVEVDKFYLLDIIKRVSAYDTLYITAKIDESNSEIIVKTTQSKQKIPVKKAEGKGEYQFAVTPSHLSNIIFSHMTKTIQGEPMDDLILGFRECEDKKNVELTCSDRTQEWLTKYPRAPKRELSDTIF